MSPSAGSIILRASSGSRSCINSIEPLISANSAVTVLRSPSRVSVLTASAKRIAEVPSWFTAAGADPLMGEPQFPQNFAVGAFSNPHDTHDALNAAPHSLQNLSPSGFSVLHFAQII